MVRVLGIVMACCGLISSCGSSKICQHGDVQACICPGARWAAQTCRDDREGWNACSCAEIEPPPPPPPPPDEPVVIPDTYVFDSRFGDGTSVNYPGQTFRHVLSHDFIAYIEDELGSDVESGFLDPAAGDVGSVLRFFFEFDGGADGSSNHAITLDLPAVQVTYDDVATNKDLRGKIAGNDEPGPHRDFDTELIGWPGVAGATEMIETWFVALEELALAHAEDTPPLDPTGAPIEPIYVDAEGRDYAALLSSFLNGALSMSQGLDDYLDDDTDNHGLNNPNQSSGTAWSRLEHQWDEGFGWFGAARDFGDRSPMANAGGELLRPVVAMDSNSDGEIDLWSEASFGAAVLAARRDAETGGDLGQRAYDAFLEGRAIIHHHAGSALPDEARARMLELRDEAAAAWEEAVVATIIASLNRVIREIEAPTPSFEVQARAWSRMKGHLMALQFTPRGRIARADLIAIHDAIGDAPVLTADAVTTLLSVRDELATIYAFDAADVGDANGRGGWGE
ncbi:MAG: DUF4856 domain-containing protein [Myxococcota bacterium]